MAPVDRLVQFALIEDVQGCTNVGSHCRSEPADQLTRLGEAAATIRKAATADSHPLRDGSDGLQSFKIGKVELTA